MNTKRYTWYNLAYGLLALNTEALNEEYCYEYIKKYKRFPKPEVLPRNELVNKIRILQQMGMKSSRKM